MRVAALLMLLTLRLSAADPLLVIALDGFRHDFAERHAAPNLRALKAAGAAAEQMEPVFPSTTFPNFHSMATGLYPVRHGIAGMMFRDPVRGAFQYTRNAAEGFWYGGKPVWELAEENGILAATCFWPGSEAGVNGKWPSYYRRYDSRVTHDEKVAMVSHWLRLPEGERPGLVIVYFADVDSAGHAYGPDSEQLRAAVERVDATVGRLANEARAARPRINIVILSDHGVSAVRKHIDFTADANLEGCKASNEAPMTMLYCREPERVHAELTSRTRDYVVYRRGELPAHLHYSGSARIGDLVVLPRGNDIIQALPPGDPESKSVPALKGMHGYDPRANAEMSGILIGAGPAFREGARVQTGRNLDVFSLLVKLLGIPPPPGIDGSIDGLKPLLRE